MKQPSSTITVASLTGGGIVACWALVDNFTALAISPTVVSSTSLFGMSVAGYFTPEKVLKARIVDEINAKKKTTKKK